MTISLAQLANLFFFVSLFALGFYVMVMLVLCDRYIRASINSPDVDAGAIIEATPSIFLLFSVSLIGSFAWDAVGGFCQTFV